MSSSQEIVEHVLDLSRADGCVAIVMTATAAFAHAAFSVIAQVLTSIRLRCLCLVDAALSGRVTCGKLGRVGSGVSDTSSFVILTRLNVI